MYFSKCTEPVMCTNIILHVQNPLCLSFICRWTFVFPPLGRHEHLCTVSVWTCFYFLGINNIYVGVELLACTVATELFAGLFPVRTAAGFPWPVACSTVGAPTVKGGEKGVSAISGDTQGMSLHNVKFVSHLTMKKHFLSFFL